MSCAALGSPMRRRLERGIEQGDYMRQRAHSVDAMKEVLRGGQRSGTQRIWCYIFVSAVMNIYFEIKHCCTALSVEIQSCYAVETKTSSPVMVEGCGGSLLVTSIVSQGVSNSSCAQM